MSENESLVYLDLKMLSLDQIAIVYIVAKKTGEAKTIATIREYLNEKSKATPGGSIHWNFIEALDRVRELSSR